jgi:hypothetical protein
MFLHSKLASSTLREINDPCASLQCSEVLSDCIVKPDNGLEATEHLRERLQAAYDFLRCDKLAEVHTTRIAHSGTGTGLRDAELRFPRLLNATEQQDGLEADRCHRGAFWNQIWCQLNRMLLLMLAGFSGI